MPRPDNDNQPHPFKRLGSLAVQVLGGLIALAMLGQVVADALE